MGDRKAEDDWLFKVTPGKYYGHPNPAAGYYIYNGGNPTPSHDFAELFQYPVGTQPDPNWQRAIYDFGKHVSADGTIEYKNPLACNGKLRGKLLVCRYNIGGDLLGLDLDANGGVKSAIVGTKLAT